MTTAYAVVPSPRHVYPDHPERPGRFELLTPRLDSFGAQRLDVKPATHEEVGRVHAPKLIADLEEACRQGPGIIDFAPTFVTGSSLQDALLAAGGTLGCARAVLSGAARNAFALVRPPGHHAEPERSMGFCLLNNVAVAARDALEHGLRRVAVVDYDAHHGNGTQAAFVDDERVAYLSTHQWGIYPGTGWYEEAPQARKRIVNVPLPAGAGNQTYERVADEIVAPFIETFKPELMLVSAGFDAHWNDPITSLGLSTAGYAMLSKKLVDLAEGHCGGRIVFVLEGGYDPLNVAEGAAAVFAALTGNKFADPGDASPHPEPEAGGRIEQIREWHGFG
jgi:acetoin utilization deacetylase AcuC-like enzyme